MREMGDWVSDLVNGAIKNMPVDITENEAEFLNSLPLDEVVPALKKLVIDDPDITINSRAFDALLKLEHFDRVQFLINFSEDSSESWKSACVRNLSRFQDQRAIDKLCDLVQNDPDPNVRYAAAESLGIIGNKATIGILKYVSDNDEGRDYAEYPVADAAERAIKEIEERYGLSNH